LGEKIRPVGEIVLPASDLRREKGRAIEVWKKGVKS